MAFETGASPSVQFTPRQRWSVAMTYIVIAVGLALGLNQRDRALNRASVYSNSEAGVTARYPARWLLEESPDFIFRARDMAHRGYHTSIEVSALAAGPDTSERNVLDRLNLRRAQSLVDYAVLGYETYQLPDAAEALAMAYSFVSRESSPFLEGASSVVRGLDILTISRGQALIISFRADAGVYDRELETLRWFIQGLEI